MFPNAEYIKTLVNGLKEFINTKIKSVRKDVDTKVDSINGVIDSLPQPDLSQNDSTAKDYVKNRTHWTEVKKNKYEGFSGISEATNLWGKDIDEIWIDGKQYLNIPREKDSSDIARFTYHIGEYTISGRWTSGGPNASMTPTVDDSKIVSYRYNTIVHKLPDEYVPDWVAKSSDIPELVQSDWKTLNSKDASYIKNRPNIFLVNVNANGIESDGGIKIVGEPQREYGDLSTPVIILLSYAPKSLVANLKYISIGYWDGGKPYRWESKVYISKSNLYSYRTGNQMLDNDWPNKYAIILSFTLSGSFDNRSYVIDAKDYFASADALPQHAMSADPTEDMQIATKKYVDDAVPSNQVRYTAQDLTDAQKAQTRKNISAQEKICGEEIISTLVGTGYNGMTIATSGDVSYTIPKVELKGVVYENVPMLQEAGSLLRYQIGDYKISFDMRQGKTDSIIPNDGTTEDEFKFYKDTISVIQIPQKYIPTGQKDVIINSSTEGSTKKFKITVDDAGTITATEVTESAT